MGNKEQVKHYQWPVHWSLGVLLAGWGSLPAIASEAPAIEPTGNNAEPIQLTSSPDGPATDQSISNVTPAPIAPERFAPERSAPLVPLDRTMSLEAMPLKAMPLKTVVSPEIINPPSRSIARSSAQAEIHGSTSVESAFPAGRLTEGYLAVHPRDRFAPELSQMNSLESLANDDGLVVLSQASAARATDANAIAQESESVAPIEASEVTPLAEEAVQVEHADTVLDRGGLPVGDFLESVDGLEENGIAGEGTTTSPPNASENRGDTAPAESLNGEPDQLDETTPAAEGELETEAFDSEAFDSEAFDSEEFEAEEFKFEDDVPNPPEATVEGESEGDPDLGILRLRERPLAKQKAPFNIPVFLVGNVGYIGNGNTLAGVDPVNDRLFRTGISLIASPRLAKRTALIASVQGNLYRYDELSRLNYNEVRLQTSLRHVLTPKIYGDLGWTHRQLFLQDDGDRFLYENAAFASLTRRDALSAKTNLTSFYNGRVSFADPETSSRLRNTLGISLRHDVTPALQASLTGRMTLTNFTQQSRQDFYTQGLAQLSYKLSKNVRLSLFGSLTRGNSSNRRVDFDNSTVGLSLSGNIKLF